MWDSVIRWRALGLYLRRRIAPCLASVYLYHLPPIGLQHSPQPQRALPALHEAYDHLQSSSYGVRGVEQDRKIHLNIEADG